MLTEQRETKRGKQKPFASMLETNQKKKTKTKPSVTVLTHSQKILSLG